LVIGVQNEIARRWKVIGDDYPFRIDDKGRVLRFNTPVSKVGSVYLFCLFLSHAFDRTIVPKKLAPKVTNKTRDLFQACSTIAAGGFVEGPSMSCGFPRPDGSTFLAALHKVYKLFGDGKPRKNVEYLPRPHSGWRRRGSAKSAKLRVFIPALTLYSGSANGIVQTRVCVVGGNIRAIGLKEELQELLVYFAHPTGHWYPPV
jgi:hypothetical protein